MGYVASSGEWCGDCVQCEAPEAKAPELLAPLRDGNIDTYFVRQPKTPEEVEHACNAIRVCCAYALRYAGMDPAIIRRLGNTAEHSDYVLVSERLVFVGDRRRLRWWQRAISRVRFWCSRRAEPTAAPGRQHP